MKKIALVLSTLPHMGGSHQYAHLIVEALLKNSEVRIFGICTNEYWTEWCCARGIDCARAGIATITQEEFDFQINWPLLSRYLYNRYSKIGRMIKDNKIDILFYTSQIEYIANFGVKTIAPVHDLMHRYEPSFPEVKNDFTRRERIFILQAKYCSCILTDSNLGISQFEESYTKYLSKHIIVESLPFVVPDYIENNEEEFINVPEKYIFYPAQFWKHKNHENLLKSIALLKYQIPDVKLVLSGSEKNNGSTIRKMIIDNGIEENVIILGYVTNEQITFLYKHAVALFMPTYFGPTNIPPLEAMALGCPVAVSNKYGMPEQVGNAGLLFDPDSPEEIAQCVKKVWNDKEYRDQMIINGYEQMAKWNREKFICKVNELVGAI